MTQANFKTYTRNDIVRYYAQLSRLQPAEAAISQCLLLSGAAMLDVGVGGGRTTPHFAPLVKQYTGIDYSPAMVAACRQRYPNVAFQVEDARSLPYPDNHFDFVLFSFNGIDYVSHGDRLQILRELRRVIKPGGYLCFSSHHLPAIARQFSLRAQLRLNPLATYTNLVMLGLLRLANREVAVSQLAQADYAILKDESHNFRLHTYYIHPQAQRQQLAFGFETVAVYPWSCSSPQDLGELAHCDDLWLYYLCKAI